MCWLMMESARPEQPETRPLFQRVEGESDFTGSAVNLTPAGMTHSLSPLSLGTADEARQMQVDMNWYVAATMQQDEDRRPFPTEKEAANAAASSGKNRGNQ